MNQKPIIGIVSRVQHPGNTGRLIVEEKNRQVIIKHGGNPILLLPPQLIDYTKTKYTEQNELTNEDKELLISQLNLVNGIYMPGGFKTNVYDRFIVEYAIEKDIPILGVCLGMQILSNYHKELWVKKNDSHIVHFDEEKLAHSVTLDKSSKLYSIVKQEKFDVSSEHMYHAEQNSLFDVVAVSDDNYIEAIEMKDKTFCVGVQWHPENMHDETSNRLFDEFINSCRSKM